MFNCAVVFVMYYNNYNQTSYNGSYNNHGNNNYYKVSTIRYDLTEYSNFHLDFIRFIFKYIRREVCVVVFLNMEFENAMFSRWVLHLFNFRRATN